MMFASTLRHAALLTAVISLWAGSPSIAEAADAATIIVGNYQPSSTSSLVSMPLEVLVERKDLQQKHGIKVDSKDYSNLSALYSDLAVGRVDAALTGTATLAAAAVKGAPLSMAGTIARASNVILSSGKPWSAAGLKGSRLVAQTSSSSWIVLKAIIERDLGLRAGTDYEVINSDSTAGAALQAAAGKADFAIVRAEQILLALKKFKNLKIVADAKALGREKGVADWGYIVTYNNKKQKYADMERMMAALAEVGGWMKANPDEVEARAVKSGQEPGIAKEFLTSGMLGLDIEPATKVKKTILADYELLKSVGYLATEPPKSIFAE